ncbi:MAG: TetR/AcrR family transcriptional regulator [Chloroflexia bacterium]
METTQTIVKTPKGRETRERIYQTALDLFLMQGYEETTLRDIAGAASCSLGLTYRYFASKEDLVLTLYERLAVEQASQVRALDPSPLADRFEAAMRAKLEQLEPYREPFSGMFGAALNPKSGVAVLGGRTGEVRSAVAQVFVSLVEGSKGAPSGPQAGQLASVLYALHLALILFWLYDPTPGGRATQELISLSGDILRLVRPVLKLPPVARTLRRFAAAMEPVFGAEQPG